MRARSTKVQQIELSVLVTTESQYTTIESKSQTNENEFWMPWTQRKDKEKTRNQVI